MKKAKIEERTIAIVRVRGSVKVTKKIKDTLKMLNLKHVNNCVIVRMTPHYKGMIQKGKDYITWGEIDKKVFESMLMKWGRTTNGQRVNTAYLKEKKVSVTDLFEVKKKLKEVGIKPVFRLHPPRRGYEGIKRPFTMKGALGNRKEKINKLLERMI